MSPLLSDSCCVNKLRNTNHESPTTNHQSPRAHLLFIAYGNTLRHDDGAGLALAEKVLPLLRSQGHLVNLVAVQQLTPELALELTDPALNAVYFFDTALEQESAGIQIRDISVVQTTPVLGHHLIPSALLLYATYLYGVCPPAWLVTIPGSDFALGEGFSPTTAGYLANVELLASRLGQLASMAHDALTGQVDRFETIH